MLTYRTYLRLPELLRLQSPVGAASSSDERLFIAVHQIYELWFMLLLDALQEARDRLLAGELPAARLRLARVISVQRQLVTQVDVAETMSLAEFTAFRESLGSASGYESAQYREIEYLSGVKNPEHLHADWLCDDERVRMDRRLAEPSVWDAYLAALRARGLPAGTPEQVIASVCAVAADESAFGDLWAIAEDLRTYDGLAASWRLRHAQLAERFIGMAKGTGGSRGAAYLHEQVNRRYFPLLWQLSLKQCPCP
jgi:tryptophan 2,3-dioxygenase